MEEPRKLNRDWNTFLFLSKFDPDIRWKPSRRSSSSSRNEDTPKGSVKGPFEKQGIAPRRSIRSQDKGKDIIEEEKQGEVAEGHSVEEAQYIMEVSDTEMSTKKMKGNKLQFIPEVAQSSKPRKSMTRRAAREVTLHVTHSEEISHQVSKH